jgi:hypothetical protein
MLLLSVSEHIGPFDSVLLISQGHNKLQYMELDLPENPRLSRLTAFLAL